MRAKGADAGEIAAALDRLQRRGLQHDGRFAALYAEHRLARGFGPRRVAQELKSRGVQGEDIAAAIAALADDFAAQAAAVRRKKFSHAPLSLAERARQARFLEYRGFQAEHIRHALENAVSDEDN